MVFGGGAFGRHLGPEGGALLSGLSALVRETPESLCVPFCLRRTRGPWLSLTQEACLTRHRLCLDVGLPSLQNWEQEILAVFKPFSHDILLWQPE